MDVRVTPVTDSVAVAVLCANTAEMLVEPALAVVATPSLPSVFEIVATDEFALAHVAASVMSWVDLSENVPVATNGTIDPFGT